MGKIVASLRIRSQPDYINIDARARFANVILRGRAFHPDARPQRMICAGRVRTNAAYSSR
jgi:hypothetical protein